MQLDDLLFHDAVDSDMESLLAFRNNPGVNHFMVCAHVDPEDLWHRDLGWLDEVE